MDIISAISSRILTKDTTFPNYLLIMEAHPKIPKLYRMENIISDKVMDKLDMFQAIFVKLDEFGWWDMKRIQNYTSTQFTSKEFQEVIYVRGVQLALAAPDHQEFNGQVEVTWRTLQTIAHSIMVHALVSE